MNNDNVNYLAAYDAATCNAVPYRICRRNRGWSALEEFVVRVMHNNTVTQYSEYMDSRATLGSSATPRSLIMQLLPASSAF